MFTKSVAIPMVACLLIVAHAAAQQGQSRILPGAPADQVTMPQRLPADEFNQVLVRVGENLFIAGQPTERGLRYLEAEGVDTVINLRTQPEMDDRNMVPFDQAALLETLGIHYLHIPAGGEDTPYSAAMVTQFAEALANARGKVLLHCTVAWRASHLYTAYLYRHAGLSLTDAVRHGRAINLGQLPVEGFLGQEISLQLVELVDDE